MAFNPLQNFQQGFQSGQQQKLSGLRNNLADAAGQQGFNPADNMDFQQLAVLDPSYANKVAENFEKLDKPRKRAYFVDMQQGLRQLETGNGEGFLDTMSQRLDAIDKLGGDPQGTTMLINKYNQGDIQGLVTGLRGVEQQGIKDDFLSNPLDEQIKQAQLAKATSPQAGGNPDQVQSSEILSDGTIVTVGKYGGNKVYGPDGVLLKGAVAKKHFSKVKAEELEHTRKMKKLETEAALTKARASGMVAREGEDITLGVNAAQTIPILMRSDRLLDMVGTGKPQAAKLWAKKMLGIESGDETELEQLLGKQIVKQLKPTFGGSFSVQEGAWLQGMEADWGRSTEGNRRLIRAGLALANERADIGYRAAEASGDTRTTGVIQGYRDWRFPEATQKSDAQKSTSEMSLEELKAMKTKLGGG
tara:strand:- start:2848 stop:4098 length:1251 start_codon:yes stop_codon:yes gene_type:complete